jgi:hypothetical protein
MTRAAALAVSACLFAACGGSLAAQRTTIQSNRATTASVVEAWLSSQVSSAYTGVVLEQTFRLTEKTRAALTSSPAAAAKPQAAALAQACEHLSRQIAALAVAVAHDDRGRAQQLHAQVKRLPLP